MQPARAISPASMARLISGFIAGSPTIMYATLAAPASHTGQGPTYLGKSNRPNPVSSSTMHELYEQPKTASERARFERLNSIVSKLDRAKPGLGRRLVRVSSPFTSRPAGLLWALLERKGMSPTAPDPDITFDASAGIEGALSVLPTAILRARHTAAGSRSRSWSRTASLRAEPRHRERRWMPSEVTSD